MVKMRGGRRRCCLMMIGRKKRCAKIRRTCPNSSEMRHQLLRHGCLAQFGRELPAPSPWWRVSRGPNVSTPYCTSTEHVGSSSVLLYCKVIAVKSQDGCHSKHSKPIQKNILVLYHYHQHLYQSQLSLPPVLPSCAPVCAALYSTELPLHTLSTP